MTTATATRTATILPEAPSSVPRGCFRDADGNIAWFGDEGYIAWQSWDGNEYEWEDYYESFTHIRVGEFRPLTLESADFCDGPSALSFPEEDPWVEPPF